MGAFDWHVDGALPVMDIVTPRNVNMCGIFGRSFAYFTIKERLPIIITKVIDHLSRDRESIAVEYGKESLDECKQIIGYLSKMKNEIQTNKKMESLTVRGGDVDKWNSCIYETPDPYYFTNIWLFTECYVYRRIREAFQLTTSLNRFDPFRLQKDTSFEQSVEAMCVVANYLIKILAESDTVSLRDNFLQLLKMTLWGNKCDLSLSAGEDVSQSLNPLKMVEKFQDNVIVDQCGTVYDQLMEMNRDAQNKNLIIDYVCDNAGYELFVDLCFADFLISKRLASKIRFHVKAMPWFVSDVIVRDFSWSVERTASVSFEKTLDSTSDVLTSSHLNSLGSRWREYMANNVWTCEEDEFWTLPHEFYKMKDLDAQLYSRLGEACMVIFKGDLNYRKLMGEMNWPPTTLFEAALRGFHPAPLIAIRTVKADLISGLPPGKKEELDKINEKWMETGDFGDPILFRKIVVTFELWMKQYEKRINYTRNFNH